MDILHVKRNGDKNSESRLRLGVYQEGWPKKRLWPPLKMSYCHAKNLKLLLSEPKSQIWIAVSVYVLIAIIKKRLGIKENLYTILQVLSITVFEKTPLVQAVSGETYNNKKPNHPIQLKLFN